MRCPFCNSEKTRVIDKRIAEDSTNRRRRECIACGKRFTTYERIEISEKTKNKVPYVKKRDGKVVEFEHEKITEAIFKAAESVGGHDRKIAEQLSEEVVKVINERYDISNIPNVEEIQDIVEKVLIEKGHAKTAKAYILYRQKHTEIREIKNTMIDVNETIRGYLDRLDWRVRENSNEMFSFSGLLLYTAGKVMANYNLNEMYTPAISNAHVSGDLHIHDLSHGVIAYCCGHSLKNLLLMGFGGVPNKVECKPAKHLSTVVHQLVNYIGCLQMEFAGAQAFSSVDTLLAPFVREDALDFKQVKQCMQQLTFSLNIPSRWGCFSEDTEILTEKGWKLGKELKVGDIIATFNVNNEKIEYLPVKRMTIDSYNGKMYNLKNRIMNQLVTPNHRVLRKIHNFDENKSESKYVFEEAAKLKTSIPLIPLGGRFNGTDMHEDYVRALAWIVSEGSLCRKERIAIHQSFVKNPQYCEEIRNCLNNLEIPFDEQIKKSGFTGEMSSLRFRMNRPSSRKICDEFFFDYIKQIPDELRSLNTDSARVFIETYMKADGHPPENRIYTKNKRDADVLQEMIIKAGWGSTILKNKNGIYVVRAIKHDCSQITSINQIDYEGIVWCPTTDNNTVIVRRNGKAFISGNSQYPFSNLTFDIKCPQDLAEEKAIVGGKRMPYTYADCQKEMDMINKAFLEVMVEGDASGGVFTFPIPTYNLTKDFDWDGEIAKLLFEVAAKYGLPYFQNYIGSGLNSRSIRAMCLHPAEEIIVKKEGRMQKTTIGALVEEHAIGFNEEGWSENTHNLRALALGPDFKIRWTPIKRFLRLKGRILSEITTKDGKAIKVSSDHLIPVMTDSGIKIKRAEHISTDDYMLTARNALSALSIKYQKMGEFVFDEVFAKFAGLFISEGNYLYDSRKKEKSMNSLKGFQFTFNSKEVDRVEELKDIIKNKFGYAVKTKKDARYNAIMIYMYNTKLTKSLYKAGLRKYKRVPPQLFNSPKSVIEVFLDYVFKGDGYAKGKELHLNDKPLSRELALLYTIVGRYVTYNMKKNSQVIRIQHNQGRGSRNKHIRDVLYDRVPSFMVDFNDVDGARRANFRQAQTVGTQLIERFGGYCNKILNIFQNDVALVKVKKVLHKLLEKEQLFYDIELEGNHLFVHSLGTITHNCCRLNMDTSQLINRPGGMWSMGDSTGSIGVVTINMSRIGYEAKTKEEYFEKLRHLMLLAKDSLEIKRKVISKNLENGLMPYTKRYLGSFHNHFSTVGLVGMHESCLNFLKKGIETEEGKQFTIEVLNFMREQLREFQQETSNLYNLEATPAESTSYRLAMLDKKKYPDIITSGKKTPYLTNSTQLSVDYTDDIITALEHQKDIQPLYTGGTIFHTFLGERLNSGEACKRLVKKIAYNTRLPYFSITPTFSLCKSHGYLKGEQPVCPECGAETEVYSRIVGYIRPIKNWNDGKQEEFKDRVVFAEKRLENDFKTKIEKALEKKEVIIEA